MPDHNQRPQTLKSEQVFAGRKTVVRRDVIRLPSGRETAWEVVEHPGAVAILAFLDGEHIVLVRQYRYAVNRELYELPAGTLEPGEDPTACAARELEEETGYRPGCIVPMISYFSSPGIMTERMYLCVAWNLESTETKLEDGECLSTTIVEWPKALEMIAAGEIEDGKTICAILYAAQFRVRDRIGDE